MIKGETKSGIKFELNPKVKEDARLLYFLTKIHDEDADVQNKALFDILKLIFGGDDGVMSFMNAVAEVHDGICSPACMLDELTEMFNALDLKN